MTWRGVLAHADRAPHAHLYGQPQPPMVPIHVHATLQIMQGIML